VHASEKLEHNRPILIVTIETMMIKKHYLTVKSDRFQMHVCATVLINFHNLTCLVMISSNGSCGISVTSTLYHVQYISIVGLCADG